eukprot:m.735628 g.735628  ORF g.735628 m.735628 type:complete len:331 (-) comp23091_c0_seq9:3856-4848(-)
MDVSASNSASTTTQGTTSPVVVQSTNDISTLSKISAVRAGYFRDPYLEYFLPSAQRESTQKKEPEDERAAQQTHTNSTKKKYTRGTRRAPGINLGYYVRFLAVQRAIHKWLAVHGVRRRLYSCSVMESNLYAQSTPIPTLAADIPKNSEPYVQIVSLGAGFDTLFWRLTDEYHVENHTICDKDSSSTTIRVVEIDFPEVACAKKKVILAHPVLRTPMDIFPNPENVPCTTLASIQSTPVMHDNSAIVINTKSYTLLGADLSKTASLTAALDAAGVDSTLPTLVLSECVLAYLDPAIGDDVLQWAARCVQMIALFLYLSDSTCLLNAAAAL